MTPKVGRKVWIRIGVKLSPTHKFEENKKEILKIISI